MANLIIPKYCEVLHPNVNRCGFNRIISQSAPRLLLAMSNLRPRVVCTELLRLVFASKVGDFYGFLWISGISGATLKIVAVLFCVLFCVLYFDGFSVFRSDTPQKSGSQQHFWPAPFFVGRVLNNSTKGIALLNGRREPQGTAGFSPQSPSSF